MTAEHLNLFLDYFFLVTIPTQLMGLYRCHICLQEREERGESYIISLSRLMKSVFLMIRNTYEKNHWLQVMKKIVNPQYFNSHHSFLFNHIFCLFPPSLYAISPSLIKR